MNSSTIIIFSFSTVHSHPKFQYLKKMSHIGIKETTTIMDTLKVVVPHFPYHTFKVKVIRDEEVQIHQSIPTSLTWKCVLIHHVAVVQEMQWETITCQCHPVLTSVEGKLSLTIILLSCFLLGKMSDYFIKQNVHQQFRCS